MRSLNKAFAAAAVATIFAVPTAFAQATQAREDMDYDKFVKMCDTDKDGMVSKAEVMKMVEKMFDKQDTKKMGKLDKKQVEFFLKELTRSGG